MDSVEWQSLGWKFESMGMIIRYTDSDLINIPGLIKKLEEVIVALRKLDNKSE